MSGLRIAALAASFALAAPVAAQPVTDHLSTPGPIEFGGESFVLAWSSNPSRGYYKHEYVPAGQDVEAYDRMFLIDAVAGAVEPMQAAGVLVQNLEQRREDDPMLNFDIVRNEASGEVLLDFLISDLDADPPVVEWNAYRYAALEGGDGLVLYGISHRGYGEDGGMALLESLATLRAEARNELATMELPQVTLP
jgi:hypothetical protein